jgi:hypothetical protein
MVDNVKLTRCKTPKRRKGYTDTTSDTTQKKDLPSQASGGEPLPKCGMHKTDCIFFWYDNGGECSNIVFIAGTSLHMMASVIQRVVYLNVHNAISA